MALLDKIFDFVSGGIGGKVVDAVAAHFPPSMSEKEKEQLKLAITQASREYELELLRVAQQEQESFNARLKELEGTASDLNNAGWPGRIILFLRGAQRPVWGFAVLYMDLMVFSGAWRLSGVAPVKAETAAGAQAHAALADPLLSQFDLQSSFWVINFLVLGFLFGERAMRNVIPFFQARFGGGQVATQPAGSAQDRAVG